MSIDKLWAIHTNDCYPQYFLPNNTPYLIINNKSLKFQNGIYSTIGLYRKLSWSKKDTFLVMVKCEST